MQCVVWNLYCFLPHVEALTEVNGVSLALRLVVAKVSNVRVLCSYMYRTSNQLTVGGLSSQNLACVLTIGAVSNSCR